MLHCLIFKTWEIQHIQLLLYVFLWAWELKLLGVSFHNHLGELERILIDYFSVSFKAGFHQRRSRSLSRNQKRRAIDLVKIKHWFCLWLCRLRSSENCIVGVTSRSGRINQWQCSTLGLAIGWFLRFCFRPRQPSFLLDHERRSRKQNRKKWKCSDSSDSDSVELMTPLTTPIFDSHLVIRSLMTLTVSLVKTSL